jgi:hypothetical protein
MYTCAAGYSTVELRDVIDARMCNSFEICDLVVTGVIGAYAFMGPKAGRDTFGVSGKTADLAFGAITVLTGIFGTLMGGFLLDRIGSTMRNALLICGCSMIIGYAKHDVNPSCFS